MMSKDDVRAFLTRQPFVPFTLHLSDGRSFRVEHPDFLIIPPERNMTLIVYRRGGGFDFVYLKLITSISSEGDPPHVTSAKENQSGE